MADTSGNEEIKAPRRNGGKPSKNLKVPAAGKVKSTIHLSREASQRLDVHASMMDLNRSDLVEKLINEHLRRYVVSDRGKPGETSAA